MPLSRKCEVAICRRLGFEARRHPVSGEHFFASCSQGCAHVCLPVGPAGSGDRYSPNFFYKDNLRDNRMKRRCLPSITSLPTIGSARLPTNSEAAKQCAGRVSEPRRMHRNWRQGRSLASICQASLMTSKWKRASSTHRARAVPPWPGSLLFVKFKRSLVRQEVGMIIKVCPGIP